MHPRLIPGTSLGRDVTEEVSGLITSTDEHSRPLSNEEHAKFKTVEAGAATGVWCAISARLNNRGGVYCEDVDIAEAVPADSLKATGVRPWAIDPELADQLWELSEVYTGVKSTPESVLRR